MVAAARGLKGRRPSFNGRTPTSPEKFALAVVVAVFAGGTIGLLLQRILHESFTSGGSRDMIGAVGGLLTLLSVLTMGLLIWTA